MKSKILNLLGALIIGNLICLQSSAQSFNPKAKDIDLVFDIAWKEKGKSLGSVKHEKNTEDLATFPLVHRVSGTDNHTHVVTISYVGYANFQPIKNAKKEKIPQLRSGYVFAVQVFYGEEGVTAKTAKNNSSKLIIYNSPSQIFYTDDSLTVTVSRKK